MVRELVKLYDHDLFENIQISDHNVRLLSNVDPVNNVLLIVINSNHSSIYIMHATLSTCKQ